MKNYQTEIKIVLDILIAFVLAIIIRNVSAEMRNGLHWGGEIFLPMVVAAYHLGGKDLVKSFIQDMRGER